MVRMVLLFVTLLAATTAHAADYVVVVSDATQQDPSWRKVTQALIEKHHADVVTYKKAVSEALPALAKQHPRHTCFVATPEEATREFVAAVHQLTRNYDSYVYTDTLWGILTGFDSANSLAIATTNEPLVVRKAASGTEIALEMCEAGLWYDELVKNKKVEKTKGGEAVESAGPDDTTAALAQTLTDYQADLFVTSGHATERDWMIGYTYRNGFFVSTNGQMFGRDTQNHKFKIRSDNPKVYLAVGNCLMGNINGPDAMALAWMNSCGVRQMVGYTVLTWYGYGGWGCLDYFVEQPGRYSLTEAFHANHHALMHRLETIDNQRERRGLEYDRDVVALYGDPAWEARMAPAKCAYEQTLKRNADIYTFTILPQRGRDSFRPINTNGAQRGWRPMVQFLPERIGDAEVLSGAGLKPVITDDFILIPNPRECDPSRDYVVTFRASPRES